MSPKNVDPLGRACLLIVLVCLSPSLRSTSNENFVFQCSVYECGTEGWNIRQMNMFLQQYGREQQSFWCYHQPPNSKQYGQQQGAVVVEKMDWHMMFHAVLWPTGCLVVGAVLWVGLCFGCWKLDRKQQEYEHYRKV